MSTYQSVVLLATFINISLKKKLELVVLTLKSYTFLDLINANLHPDQPQNNNIYS